MSYEHETISTPHYQRATALYEKALGRKAKPDRRKAYLAALEAAKRGGDPEVLAALWYYVAQFFSGEGADDDAVIAYVSVLETEAAFYGADSEDIAGTWSGLTAVLVEGGSNAAVSELVARISRAAARGDDHETTAQLIVVLWDRMALDRIVRWAPWLAKAKSHEPQAHRCLGHALSAVGLYADARRAYATALEHLDHDDEHRSDAALGAAEAELDAARPHVKLSAAVLAGLDRDRDGDEARRTALALVASGGKADLRSAMTVAAGLPELEMYKLTARALAAGVTAADLRRALAEVATGPAIANLVALELTYGFDARPTLDKAIAAVAKARDEDQVNMRTALVRRRVLLAVDDGDDKMLAKLAASDMHLARLAQVVVDLEREPNKQTLAAAIPAFRAYATAHWNPDYLRDA